MALNQKTSVASRNLALNASYDVLNVGFCDLYDGTQPTDSDTAITSQVKLSHNPLSATAFAPASGGNKVANAIANGVGLAVGTATWARWYKSDGVTAVFDCSVGTSASNIIMADVAITVNGVVVISGYTCTQAP